MPNREQPAQERDAYSVVADAQQVWKRPVRYQTIPDAIESYKRIALLYILARADGQSPCADMLERWNDEVWDSLPEYARKDVQTWIARLTAG